MSNNEMIDYLVNKGVLKIPCIIEAFRSVDRKDFVLRKYEKYAYADEPLPLVEGQTISQPSTVAAMTEALEPVGKILEIGAGSGYQAAILSKLSEKVVTIEYLPSVIKIAKQNLKDYDVKLVHGDGSKGYAKDAPYDRIIVTAAAPDVPEPLLTQLKKGGRMVIPVGNQMFLVQKDKKVQGKIKKTFLGFYMFVPLRGVYGYK
jgi:protein-L-isoaspartate(D-aspartate) O-methyltransferase